MKTVSDIIKRIIQQQPYYGMFLCGINKEFTDDPAKMDTAGVCLEGINFKLLINRKFWDGLPPNLKFGVLHHEVNK